MKTLLIALLAISSMTVGQPQLVKPPMPFGVGEELTYEVHFGRFGNKGRGVMRIADGPVLRGRETRLLSFDVEGRVMLFKVSSRTRSVVDDSTLRSLRYTRLEKSPRGTQQDSVEIFPGEKRWESASEAGETPCPAPLDELSFIYFIRTLPLPADAHYTVQRHFNAARNPVTIDVVGFDTVQAAGGLQNAVVVDMHVNDASNFGGSGTIRFYFSDDAAHIPLRIESSMPVAGKMVLVLESRKVAQ